MTGVRACVLSDLADGAALRVEGGIVDTMA